MTTNKQLPETVEIKRYTIYNSQSICGGYYVVEDKDGEWVKHSEVSSLTSEIEKLREEKEKQDELLKECYDLVMRVKPNIPGLGSLAYRLKQYKNMPSQRETIIALQDEQINKTKRIETLELILRIAKIPDVVIELLSKGNINEDDIAWANAKIKEYEGGK